MSYSSVYDYFDHIELEDVDLDSEYDERLANAEVALDEVTDADIEEFDVHDAIATISHHFDVERDDLLKHYDR